MFETCFFSRGHCGGALGVTYWLRASKFCNDSPNGLDLEFRLNQSSLKGVQQCVDHLRQWMGPAPAVISFREPACLRLINQIT